MQTRNNFVSTKQEVEKLMKRIKSADQDYNPPGQWTMEGFLYVQEKREFSHNQVCVHISVPASLSSSLSSSLHASPPACLTACRLTASLHRQVHGLYTVPININKSLLSPP